MSSLYLIEIVGGENGGEAIFEDIIANGLPELRKHKWQEINIQTYHK